MKKIIILIFLMLTFICQNLYSHISDVKSLACVEIRNQEIIGNELHFDIYVTNFDSVDKYYFGGDFIITLNRDCFTNPKPTLTLERDSILNNEKYDIKYSICTNLAGNRILKILFFPKTRFITSLIGEQGTDEEVLAECRQKMVTLPANARQNVHLGHVSISGLTNQQEDLGLSFVINNEPYPKDFYTIVAFLDKHPNFYRRWLASRFYLTTTGDNPSSVDENLGQSTSKIIIYPNPSNSEVTIKIPAYEGIAKVQIYSLEGVLVTEKEAELFNNEVIIPINNYSTGQYLAKVYSDKGLIIGTAVFTLIK